MRQLKTIQDVFDNLEHPLYFQWEHDNALWKLEDPVITEGHIIGGTFIKDDYRVTSTPYSLRNMNSAFKVYTTRPLYHVGQVIFTREGVKLVIVTLTTRVVHAVMAGIRSHAATVHRFDANTGKNLLDTPIGDLDDPRSNL